MLEFKSVAYSYSNSDACCVALHEISVSFAAGKHVCIVGANGSGKSTLLRLANTTLLPSSGKILLDGQPMAELTSHEVHRRVGIVKQDPCVQIVSSLVLDEVSFGPQNLGLTADEIEQRSKQALDCVGLAGFEQRSTHSLSGGEQQRLALAGVLAMKPDYVLLDEITSHLDVASRQRIRNIVDGLADAGVGVVEVSHYAQDVQEADAVILLEQGRVTWQGLPGELLESPELLKRSCLVGASGCHAGCFVDANRAVTRAKSGAVALCASQASMDDILHGVSLEVGAGDLHIIAGKSGAGKSTLAQVLAGLIVPDAGKVTCADLQVQPGAVGLAFQRVAEQLFCDTVLDDVMFGPQQGGMPEAQARAQATQALQLLGIEEELYERNPLDLSGGQARRVALAGIIALKTGVCIFDEPTAGLDAVGREELHAVVATLCKEGRTVIVVTHDIEEWLAQAQTLTVLDTGHVVWSGAAKKAKPVLVRTGLINSSKSSEEQGFLAGGCQ